MEDWYSGEWTDWEMAAIPIGSQGRELVDEIKLPRSGGAPADAPEESRPADESQG